jgi:Transposase zinc-ribbon domain
MESANEPKTLQEAIVYFADPVNCRNYLVARRWSKGVTCPRCGSEDVLFLEKYNRWHCRAKHPAPQFTLKTGTIMEDSPIGLDKWLMTMWMVVNCRNGVSSYEIHRDIGVTQKTAWFLEHRIRLAMQDEYRGGKPVERSRSMKPSSAVRRATCPKTASARFRRKAETLAARPSCLASWNAARPSVQRLAKA